MRPFDFMNAQSKSKALRGTGGSFDTFRRFSSDCNTFANVNLLVDIEKAFLVYYVPSKKKKYHLTRNYGYWIDFDNILIKIKKCVFLLRHDCSAGKFDTMMG